MIPASLNKFGQSGSGLNPAGHSLPNATTPSLASLSGLSLAAQNFPNLQNSYQHNLLEKLKLLTHLSKPISHPQSHNLPTTSTEMISQTLKSQSSQPQKSMIKSDQNVEVEKKSSSKKSKNNTTFGSSGFSSDSSSGNLNAREPGQISSSTPKASAAPDVLARQQNPQALGNQLNNFQLQFLSQLLLKNQAKPTNNFTSIADLAKSEPVVEKNSIQQQIQNLLTGQNLSNLPKLNDSLDGEKELIDVED